MLGLMATRITIHQARKRYAEGLPVVFCPCKLYPFGGWAPGIEITPKPDEWDEGDTAATAFTKRVNAFTYYNCNYESGYYPAYYLPQ